MHALLKEFVDKFYDEGHLGVGLDVWLGDEGGLQIQKGEHYRVHTFQLASRVVKVLDNTHEVLLNLV